MAELEVVDPEIRAEIQEWETKRSAVELANMKHIVSFSGGVGSYCAAKRVVERYGPDKTILLFADTRMEDEDLYRFLWEASDKIGAPLETVADGRTPWEVFRDEKYIGNTRVDICSRILKRDLLDSWIEENYGPEECVVYVGVDWSEVHRYERLFPRKLPYIYKAPMCDPPLLDKGDMLEVLGRDEIVVPRLYQLGFPHNNCGGFCVKAGQGHFKLLYEKMPERFLEHEEAEESLREHIGKDVAILRDRSQDGIREHAEKDPDFEYKEWEDEDGNTVNNLPNAAPLTLHDLRKRIEANDPNIDENDFGGCGCAID